jgi:putative transposase
MRLCVCLLAWFLRAILTSRRDLGLENPALRQQLATYARRDKRPRLKPEERAFWAALCRVWQNWRSPLRLLKPATVIEWHRRGLRRYWR